MFGSREWRWWIGCFFVVFVIAAPRDASAYIDPGAGALAYQTFLGLLLGAIVFLRQVWARIRGRAERTIPPPDASRAEHH